MNISRRDFVDALLLHPLSSPLNFIAKGESPAIDKPSQWACYAANAAATGATRLAVPAHAAEFAALDAGHRGKGPVKRARAAVVGFAAGTVVSTVGIVWNVGQVLVGACMTGVATGVATFAHGLESIEANREGATP